MKTKQRDTRYCGVDRKRIASAKPTISTVSLVYFREFITERYKIHVKKDVLKLEKPWTENCILQKYKFTNVRREHDRQSRELIRRVSTNPKLSLEEKIANTFLFRAWNNADTFDTFGGPWKLNVIYDPLTKESARAIYREAMQEDPKRLWFSSAYNQGGTKSAWKFPAGDGYERAYKESEARKYPDWEPDIPLRVFHVGVWLGRDKVIQRILASKNQERCFEVIKSVRGFADFLAYQVFVDLTYIEEFPFSENEFVIAGPGCKRGMDTLFIDRDGMTYEECLFWLRDKFNKLMSWLEKKGNWPEDDPWDPNELFMDLEPHDACMNVMSLENCFCEFSKYIKAFDGVGRPRVRYDGV